MNELRYKIYEHEEHIASFKYLTDAINYLQKEFNNKSNVWDSVEGRRVAEIKAGIVWIKNDK